MMTEFTYLDGYEAGLAAARSGAPEGQREIDEALVERVARVLFEKEVENMRMGKASLDEEFEVNHEYWCASARAALAVITEPVERDFSVG